MTLDFEQQLQGFARAFTAIAHTLEADDDAPARIERVMAHLRAVVPYRRCAILERSEDGAEILHLVPADSAEERAAIHARMVRTHELVTRADAPTRSADASRGLSLPLIGLDSVIGVLRVEPEHGSYDATHLRVLAVVAAQLGAFLATNQLRRRDRLREEQLAAAHDFQQLIAGVVSHDLRNPLAVITMVASNLLDLAPDGQQAEALRRALRNAQHAARLIADLADVTEARVSGAMALSLQTRPLAAMLQTIVDDLRSASPQSTIELVCDCDAELTVTWDAERMTQVLSNLVNNALGHGAVGLPVRVTAWIEAERVAVRVHNYGPAIPQALLPTIFDPFKHGAERPRPGTVRGLGLGLYIVDQIVKSHAGEIALTSDDLEGTTFTLRLPRVCVGDRAAPGSEHPLVLVVDDDEDVRVGLTGLLEKRGFRVTGAADGLEALALLERGARPKLILLDLAMPRMSGDELLDRLHANPELAAIPVVIISADTSSAMKVARERAQAILAKPVSVERLLAAIEKLP